MVTEDRRVPARARIALASAFEGNGDVPLRGLRAGGVSVNAASVRQGRPLGYTPPDVQARNLSRASPVATPVGLARLH